jgi:drug/metabolite transporter (DMT)-like permease
MTAKSKQPSSLLVFVAFGIVYLVWGSTYFFIQRCVAHFPPFIIGMIRFLVAGSILMIWCAIKGEKLNDWKQIRSAAVTGILLLFIGNGAVIWSEQALASSLVAVLVSAAPIWFVLLDRAHWGQNFSSRSTVIGLIVGFLGVLLLFSNEVFHSLSETKESRLQIIGLILLIIGSVSWSAGSLYAKYRSSGSAITSTAWQMVVGGLAFVPASLISGEWKTFHVAAVPWNAWFSLIYLIVFGSLVAYSAYVWLLQVRPATQVSTYAYVNPVVAVVLGIFLANEAVTWVQILGLLIILASVLLINLTKYRRTPHDGTKAAASETGQLLQSQESL